MMVRPAANIIRNVPVALALVPQEGPMFENSLASKAAREQRHV
jgi:hypothetical protein